MQGTRPLRLELRSTTVYLLNILIQSSLIRIIDFSFYSIQSECSVISKVIQYYMLLQISCFFNIILETIIYLGKMFTRLDRNYPSVIPVLLNFLPLLDNFLECVNPIWSSAFYLLKSSNENLQLL